MSTNDDRGDGEGQEPHHDDRPPPGMRRVGGGEPLPAGDPLDRSVRDDPAGEQIKHAPPPKEGPAAPGNLPA